MTDSIMQAADAYLAAKRAEDRMWHSTEGLATDLLAARGETEKARDALLRAVELEDSGMAATEADAVAAMEARGIDVGADA